MSANPINNDHGLLEAALEIARRRADTLYALRDALEAGDDVKALTIARKLCGLNDKKVLGAASRFNGGASSRK